MKTNISTCVKSKMLYAKFKWLLLLAMAFAPFTEFKARALYKVGQNVTNNFYFIARRPFTRPDGTAVPAGARVYIRDFAGRVVFLEWFAVWCPYCVAAAPQVKTGIADWYATRGGNPFGVPVLHVGVNQESASFYQGQTDSFVTQQGFNPVVNDYEGSVINPVRFMFQSSGQPTFVAINCVTNSPSHQSWQILVNEQRYGQTEFAQTLAGYRAIIDTVRAPVVPPSPPQLSAPRVIGSNFEFTLTTQTGRTYRVEISSNLTNWITLRTVAGSTNAILFRDTNSPPVQRFYRVVTP
ncbi:MAG: TlpA disulfide reductase family protein [Verrucomicrobiota bacterium]